MGRRRRQKKRAGELSSPAGRFAFLLCRTLAANGRGWRHPDEMLAELSVSQFRDWQLAYAADPWGEERADFRAALIAWASIHPRRFKKRLRVEDFLLKFAGTAAGPVDAARYKTKSCQRYGIIAASFDRREKRGLDEGTTSGAPQPE